MLVVPTPPFASFHGTLGNVTFQNTRGQQWLRHRPSIPNPRTAAQQATRTAMANLYQLWGTLPLGELNAWEAQGVIRATSGWAEFVRANRTHEQHAELLHIVPVNLDVVSPLDMLFFPLPPTAGRIKGTWINNSPPAWVTLRIGFRQQGTNAFTHFWNGTAADQYIFRILPVSGVPYDCFAYFASTALGPYGTSDGTQGVITP